MVVSRETVKRAVERAMLLDTSSSADARLEAAIAATAQALHLPEDEVRACVPQQQLEAA
jgi:hypothetical protein